METLQTVERINCGVFKCGILYSDENKRPAATWMNSTNIMKEAQQKIILLDYSFY